MEVRGALTPEWCAVRNPDEVALVAVMFRTTACVPLGNPCAPEIWIETEPPPGTGPDDVLVSKSRVGSLGTMPPTGPVPATAGGAVTGPASAETTAPSTSKRHTN